MKVVSDSLWTHGLYSPRNSPGQKAGLRSHPFLQGIFPTRELNLHGVSCIAGRFFTSWAPGKPNHSFTQCKQLCRYFLQSNLDMSMMEICITLSAVPSVELSWQKQLEVMNKFLESEGLWGNHSTTEIKLIHLIIPKTRLRDNLKISWVGNSMTFLELRNFSHNLNMKYP